MAANPIDFGKVWDQFGDQAETGNVVMAVVFCIYGVYFVSLVLARHADKKDQDKARCQKYFSTKIFVLLANIPCASEV